MTGVSPLIWLKNLTCSGPRPSTLSDSQILATLLSSSLAPSTGIDLRSLTTTYLAALPTAGRAEQWVDHNIDPPTELIDEVVNAGAEPRSNSVIVFAGDMEWSPEERSALTVAGEMLGTRLRERVREQLGGTYGIFVNARSERLPDQEYLASIIFGSDPSRTDELFQEVIDEINWLREGGEQEYLDTVKEQFRSDREEQLRQNNFWLTRIQSSSPDTAIPSRTPRVSINS